MWLLKNITTLSCMTLNFTMLEMAQWQECLSPANVARVQFWASVIHELSLWLVLVLFRGFISEFSSFPSSTKNSSIFQISIQYCNLVLFIIFLALYLALICTWVIVFFLKSNYCLIPGHLFHFPEGFILCSST